MLVQNLQYTFIREPSKRWFSYCISDRIVIIKSLDCHLDTLLFRRVTKGGYFYENIESSKSLQDIWQG